MRVPSRALFVVPAFAFVVIGASPLLAKQETKDPVPNGCVSCHIKTEDGDHTLKTVLAAKKHLSVATLKTLPTDCLKCHKNMETTFSQFMHKAHFGKGEASEFVKKFKGDCNACHKMDPKTGKAAQKSGPKNW